MNSHRRLLIGWLQKVGVGFLALALGGYAVSTNAAESRESAKLVAWKIPFEGSGSRPVLVDGVLYVGSKDGAVYALNSNTGETKWRFQTGESIPQVITVPGGTSLKEVLEKGERRVNMTPAVENGTVFIGSGDRSFYAIDAATGKKKWSYEAGFGMASQSVLNRPLPAPVVKNGTVYFVTAEGLHALDMLTGERRWLFEASEEIPGKGKYPPGGPILSDGVIFLTAGSRSDGSAEIHKRIHAVDPESGKTKWGTTITVDASDWVFTAPGTAKRLAILAVLDPHQHSKKTASPPVGWPPAHDGAAVYAISADDGQIRWKFSVPHLVGPPRLLVVDKTIYFTTDKRLIAAELETGRQLWTFSPKTTTKIKTYGAVDECPNLWADDQHVYVVTEADVLIGEGTVHRLQALDRTTGREKWLLTVGGGSADIQMIYDGLIYAGGLSSGLIVIDPAKGKMLWSFNGATQSETARLISGNRIFLISGPDTTDHGYLYAIDKPAKFRRQANKP